MPSEEFYSQSARTIVDEHVIALKSVDNSDPVIDKFIELLTSEMQAAQLVRNILPPQNEGPSPEWRNFFNGATKQRFHRILDSIHNLDPLYSWIYADKFYPDPRHRYFSRTISGTMIFGEDDALFHTESRYIALLMVMNSNTIYPLHAHRIEELYLVLSGHAEWSHDGQNWTMLPPGSVFFNKSYQPHTMRTIDEPLMAMAFYLPPFGWEGGLIEAPQGKR